MNNNLDDFMDFKMSSGGNKSGGNPGCLGMGTIEAIIVILLILQIFSKCAG